MSLRSFVPGNELPAETRPTLQGPEQTSILRHFLTDDDGLLLKVSKSLSNLVMEITTHIVYFKELGSNRLIW